MSEQQRTAIVIPPLDEAMTCFCGHDLFKHDEYGPCAECNCRAWQGCLVFGGRKNRRSEA